jgi:hypothetical protein
MSHRLLGLLFRFIFISCTEKDDSVRTGSSPCPAAEAIATVRPDVDMRQDSLLESPLLAP